MDPRCQSQVMDQQQHWTTQHNHLSMPLSALFTGSCCSQKPLPLFSSYLYRVHLSGFEPSILLFSSIHFQL